MIDSQSRAQRNLRRCSSPISISARAPAGGPAHEFLRSHRAGAIYLVGDIVDGWRLRTNWYRPPEHDEVLQELLRAAQQGTRVIYVPGNHDEFLRDYCGIHFAGIEVVDWTIRTAADGRRYVVTHGDRFDRLVDRTRGLAKMARGADLTVIAVNSGFDRMRRLFGLPSWSPIRWAKHDQDREPVSRRFEKSLARTGAPTGREREVICGHYISPRRRSMSFGLRYIDCGDWVESCTAVAEGHDGSSRFSARSRCRAREYPPAAARPPHARPRRNRTWHPQVNGVVRT